MTAQIDTPNGSAFDLDLTIVESGPVIPVLMGNTDDNCGVSCQSACSNSNCE
ncbi:FxLD family lanthipeptide [Kibdelosporangium phytohabitans]|uniref:FxLD family lanthipeptide n=1 Tax=Kibdelosporangium phytohabitans TaxID=860235 RepID=UPI0009FACBC0|nr:FxLD family lanthipeptide [Kibdelosporangium phytohabitans]MBE1467496.1 FxLD family lantipeptide [Kibdelosporangium phytohabitans]